MAVDLSQSYTSSMVTGWSQPETPEVCDRRWRTLIPALPRAANSGQYRATVASRSSSPRSTSTSAASEVIAFGGEHVGDGVLGPRHGAGLVGPAAPQVDRHLAVDVDGERGAEVFPRRELGREQLAQGVEAGAARAAQRRRVFAHEAPVQESPLKPTPTWRG